jgi:hypothetical protein
VVAVGDASAATTAPTGTAAATPTAAPAVDTPTSTPTPTAAAAYNTNQGGGGGKNEVRAVNRRDGQLDVQGNIQLKRIPGPTAQPVNLAYVYSSCIDCTTIAVALQINLISRDARWITPQNAAVALNERCSRCRTFAVALQYTYQVDAPQTTPQEVAELMREMDRELQAIATAKGITIQEAAARLDAVIGRFRALATSLDDRRSVDERDDPAGSPSPGVSPTVSGTPAPGGAATPTDAPVATPPTPGPAPASTATAGPDPSPAVTSSPTPAVTPTPPATPTPAPAPPTRTPTAVPTTAPTATPPPGATTAPTATPPPAPAPTPSGVPVGAPGASARARRHVVGRRGHPVHSAAPTGRPMRANVLRPSHAGVLAAPTIVSPPFLARVSRGDQAGHGGPRYAT